MSAPRFAVIGHPNKGKSSIVATLAEDDSIHVSPMPGTTRKARSFRFEIDGVLQYELIDTPGFQRARELLAWLEARAADADSGAAERPAIVAEFVTAHRDDPRFADECELLSPLVEGAGILYVVDGAKPYGREYELEMEVLRWTGRPRMALINLIGEGDYRAEWREALGQYFSIVREFNAVFADFEKRLELLDGFAALDESWRAPLRAAVAELTRSRERRRQDTAAELASLLAEALTLTQQRAVADDLEDESRHALELELTDRLKAGISQREQRWRRSVADLYRHYELRDAQDSATARVIDAELFAEETWQLFGLSRQQLVVTGAVSGGVLGSGFDLLLGGSSLMLGASVGAVVGGVGAWFGGDELAKVRLLGQRLGGNTLQVGPVSDPNFPWVLLGRAWTYQHIVSERNHARREALAFDLTQVRHQVDQLPGTLRRKLARCFTRLSRDGQSAEILAELTELLDEVLQHDPASDPSTATGSQD
ncbi:MAG: GTPase/DUF3482 domain-containing protein [Pseudomonadota bacterium]